MGERWALLDYAGARIGMRADTAIEQRWRLNACAKEPWTAEYVTELGPGDLLFNVGANVGSYALIAASRGARVVAVEANALNAARLAENVAANGLGERVTLVLAVCGPSEQAQGTEFRSLVAGAADIVIGEPQERGVCLPGVSLDSLSEQYGYPTHLLIDVDGGELDVLRGGPETLARVGAVMIEVSREPRISDGCVKALHAAGLPTAQMWAERDGHEIADVYYSLHRRASARE